MSNQNSNPKGGKKKKNVGEIVSETCKALTLTSLVGAAALLNQNLDKADSQVPFSIHKLNNEWKKIAGAKGFHEKEVEGIYYDYEKANEATYENIDKIIDIPQYTMTATELCQEYYGDMWSNEDIEEYRCDLTEKYSGKIMDITGEVEEVNEKYNFIELENDDPQFANIYQVRCYVEDIENYKVGEEAYIRGTFRSDDGIGFDLYMDNCKSIVK